VGTSSIRSRTGLAQRGIVAGTCLAMVALLAGFALLIHRNETTARSALTDRYETRAVLSAFVPRVGDLEQWWHGLADRAFGEHPRGVDERTAWPG
jgi:hypothetical protein